MARLGHRHCYCDIATWADGARVCCECKAPHPDHWRNEAKRTRPPGIYASDGRLLLRLGGNDDDADCAA